MQDPTFKSESLYGSANWVAATLGHSVSWFRNKRSDLEGDGFPKPDPIMRSWIKADVDAWVNTRRRIADRIEERVTTGSSTTIEGYNRDAL